MWCGKKKSRWPFDFLEQEYIVGVMLNDLRAEPINGQTASSWVWSQAAMLILRVLTIRKVWPRATVL